MSGALSGGCAPEAVDISVFGGVVGLALVAGSLFVPIPQMMKLWRLRSSEGVQPGTICLAILYGATGTAATVSMKWKQLEGCSAVGPVKCITEQLDSLQCIVAFVDWLVILLLTVALPPHNTRKWRVLAGATVGASLTLWAVTAAISIAESCGHAAVGLAHASGIASSLLVTVAFLPQLLHTWWRKSAGSLSLVFTFIQTGGCLAVAANMAFIAHDPWPAWGPTTIAGTFQGCTFCVATYFHLTRPDAAPTTPTKAGASADDGGYVPYEATPADAYDALDRALLPRGATSSAAESPAGGRGTPVSPAAPLN